VAGQKPKGNRRRTTTVEEGPVAFRSEFGERVRWLLDLFTSRTEAGDVALVSPEHLPSYISGKTKPPFELIVRLAAEKKVSLQWLATGTGERFLESGEDDAYVAVAVQPEADGPLEAAGEPPFLFSREWLGAEIKAPVGGLRMIVQRGNANDPMIRDGDALLVDTSADRIAEDALYIFVRDGRYLARFVETFADGRIALKSRNPDYGMQTLSREEAQKLQVLGRVRWRGGLLP
jgi:Peptidase S24-like